MNDTTGTTSGNAVAKAEKIAATLAAARQGIETAIFGQPRVVEETLIALLAGGHALIVGVPGLAKTRLVETVGTVFGLETRRIQFTPDLMPADIIGSEILDGDEARRTFRFVKGPLFAQLLMADEINRASPRTQSALLQAMQERQATVAGTRYEMPKPFHVLATQNPLEQEGTYPLPEAQLDRFLLQIDIGYPDREAEKEMLLATTCGEEKAVQAAATPALLMEAQALVRRIPVGEAVMEAILNLVRAARPDAGGDPALKEIVSWGPGPRASQAFMLAARARALLDGRFAPSADDVAALAEPVLAHRMALSFTARAEGLTVASVVRRLCRAHL